MALRTIRSFLTFMAVFSFLTGAAFGGLQLALTEETWRPALQPWGDLVENWEWLILLDRAYDAVPDPPAFDVGKTESVGAPAGGTMQTNSRAMAEWAREVLPYFVAENIVDKQVDPSAVTFEVLQGNQAFSVAGLTYCFFGKVELNYRYVNAVSDWSRDPDSLSTLVHELGHVEGICGWSEEMETANQLVTAEILAAMASRGNPGAVKPLLFDLRNWALVDVRLRMQDLNLDPKVYNTMMKILIYTEPWEQVRLDKSDRFWSGSEAERMDIFQRYYARPWRYALEALRSPGYVSRSLPMDPLDTMRPIQMDDLAYFLEHLPLMVGVGQRGK